MRREIVFRWGPWLLAVALAAPPSYAAKAGAQRKPTLDDARIEQLIAAAPARKVEPTANVEKVRRRLCTHVREMTELEHLAPLWYFNGTAGTWIFAQPRETFEALAPALAVLDEKTRDAALALLDRELEKFDPLTTSFYPAAGLQRFPFNAGQETRKERVSAISPPMPVFAAYGLWAYAWYGDRAEKVLARWDGIRRVFDEYRKRPLAYKWSDGTDQEAQLNRSINAMLGVARLARLAKDQATRDAARVELARLLAVRLAIEDDPRMVHVAGNGVALARYWDLSPEVARLLRENIDLARQEKWINLNTHLIADWYLAWAERPTGLMNPPGDTEQHKREYIGGEYFLSSPVFANSQFAGKALMLREDAPKLVECLDMPWCRGDLYYIAKAAAILRADSGWRFEKVFD